MLFTLKKVIGNMLLPLPLMLLIIGAGLALLWFSRFQKTGKIFTEKMSINLPKSVFMDYSLNLYDV